MTSRTPPRSDPPPLAAAGGFPAALLAHRLFPRRGAAIPGLLLGAFAFGLYVLTLAPGVVGHDAGEFQFVVPILGIPHATGYPLYLLLGKAWTFLPIGSVAWRLNLLSALFGAGAVVLTAWAGQLLTDSILAGLLAGAAVGVAPLEWTWSSIAGIRSLTVAFAAAVILAALHWQRSLLAEQKAGFSEDGRMPAAGPTSSRAGRAFILLALTVGLALDHHRTAAFFLPFLAVFVLSVDWRMLLAPRLLGQASLALLAPLLLYGVLPLLARLGAPWDQNGAGTWKGFQETVLASGVSDAHLTLTAQQVLERAPLLAADCLRAFPLLALALALAGCVWLARRNVPALILLLGYGSVIGLFTLLWNVGSQLNSVYFMAAYVPAALLAAAGVAGLAGLADRLSDRAGLALAGTCLAAVTALGLRANLARFGPQPELLTAGRQELFVGHQAERLEQAMSELPANATIVADWDQATVFWYGQFVDHLKYGVNIFYPAETLGQVLQSARGPVFLATTSVRPTRPVTSWGPFVEVLPEPAFETSAPMQPAGGSFGGEVELQGFNVQSVSYGVLPVTLYFKAIQAPKGDYSVSLRLMPSPDRVAVQNDQSSPVLGLSKTSTWIPGQVTADYHELDLRGLPDGTFDMAVVLYQALPGGGFRNLPYAGTDRALIGKLAVSKGKPIFTAAPPAGKQ